MCEEAEKDCGWWKLIWSGSPSTFRLAFRGFPSVARSLLHKQNGKRRIWTVRDALRKVSTSNESPVQADEQARNNRIKRALFLEKVLGSDLTPMQVIFGAGSSVSQPSLAQLVCHQGLLDQMLFQFLNISTSNKPQVSDVQSVGWIVETVVSPFPLTRRQPRKTILEIFLDGESKQSTTDSKSSLLRLLLCGKPPLLGLILAKKEEQRSVVLSILNALLLGERETDDKHESLAWIALTEPKACSCLRFLLLGEDAGMPSLLRLFIVEQSDKEWFMVPRVVDSMIVDKLSVSTDDLENLVTPLKSFLRSQDLNALNWKDLCGMAFEFLGELVFEIFSQALTTDSGNERDASGDKEGRAVAAQQLDMIRIALLGNENGHQSPSTLHPFYKVLFMQDNQGLYPIPTLLLVGLVGGLRVKGHEKQYVMLRWWQRELVRKAYLLQQTVHAKSPWAVFVMNSARALAEDGQWGNTLIEVASCFSSPVVPFKERTVSLLSALFEDSHFTPAQSAAWKSHWEKVSAANKNPSLQLFFEAISAKSWEKAVSELETLELLTHLPSLDVVFADLETAVVNLIEQLVPSSQTDEEQLGSFSSLS